MFDGQHASAFRRYCGDDADQMMRIAEGAIRRFAKGAEVKIVRIRRIVDLVSVEIDIWGERWVVPLNVNKGGV